MSFQDISNTLWRQRNLLEMLMFKLDEEQLILAAGRTRWIAPATREVEQVLDEIKTTEVLRATLVDALAPSLGLDPNPSLRQLVESSPEPWSSLFDEHRRAFLGLTEEVVAVSKANKDFLARGAAATRDMLATVTAAGERRVNYDAAAAERHGPYDSSGSVIALRRGGLLVDEAF